MLNDKMHTIQYGNSTIKYTLSFAERKTLAIEVHPNLSVSVKAPQNTPLPDIEAKLKKRANWILRQQRQYQSYLPHVPPRKYISGETHRYLGRQYRLKVQNSTTESVKLTRGFFYINTTHKTDTEHIKKQLTAWYRQQANRIFANRLDYCLARIKFLKLASPTLEIREMKTRWGSCTPQGKIILNLKLIQVPTDYIDYVIMHELCHLKEHHHGRQFYALLNQVMPNWQEKRERLNQQEVA